MSTFPQISEAEFEVMKIVWKYAPINTNEITEKLLPRCLLAVGSTAIHFCSPFPVTAGHI